MFHILVHDSSHGDAVQVMVSIHSLSPLEVTAVKRAKAHIADRSFASRAVDRFIVLGDAIESR